MHRHSFPSLRSSGNLVDDTRRRSAAPASDTIPEWVINESMDDRVPCPRAGHSLASFEDKLYLFGGCCCYGTPEDIHDSNDAADAGGELLHFNSLHEYSTDTNKWRCLHPGGEIRLRSRIIPKERRHASLVVYGRSLYLYGGFDRADHVLSDLWEFRIDDKKWMLVSGNPESCAYGVYDPLPVIVRVPAPVARAEHTAVVHKHRMVVFGGYDGKKKLNDTFVYDFCTRRWSSPFPARQGAPSRRCKHSAVLYKGKMYVIGGFQYKDGDNYALTDIHALDLDSFTWQNFEVDDSAPQALQGHKAVVCGDTMYIMGGKVRPRNVRHSMPASMPNQTSPVGIIPSTLEGSVTHVNLAAILPQSDAGPVSIPSDYMPDETRSSGLNHVVFTYDFESTRWAVLRTIGMPPTPRQLHAVVPVRTSDRRSSIFVFGGTDRSKQRYYNDLVQLRGIPSPTKLSSQKCETCASTKLLLNNEMFSDVKFEVEGKTIHAHKCILYARSEYFRSMFDSSMRETSASDIPIPDVSYDVFHGVLEYLYSGEVRISDGQVAVELLKAADMFRIEGLKNMCAEKVEEGVTAINAAFICQVADRHNSSNLKNYCIAYIVQNFRHVIKTESFEELMTQDAGGLGREILVAFSDSTSYVGLKRART
ncbi:BTB/POZ domain containing protein [Gracilaria domingensis]|nr:BTB/POZ domain containing protein [Gracilaria domingensis]